LKLKFQTVAEKTAKNFRGLLYFAAPGSQGGLPEEFVCRSKALTDSVK